MPAHKFLNGIFPEWPADFYTQNAILHTPYKPEVMIVGTFNPDTLMNMADMFYGRNYFWPAFKNLFDFNETVLVQRRDVPNPFLPTLDDVFRLCHKLKLTFADLIQEVHAPVGQVVNFIEDNALAQLAGNGHVNWNTKNIIDYLYKHPTIQYIYFTRRPQGIWQGQWNAIRNDSCMRGRQILNIYTPTGRRLTAPVMVNLLHHWVHFQGPNFGRLDRDWLLRHGVNPENF